MQSLLLSVLILLGFLVSNCLSSESQSEQVSLILAVKKSKSEQVRELLAKGYDPNSRDEFGVPVLHWACDLDKSGNIIKQLLDGGSKIDAKDKDNWIALDWAHKASNIYGTKQLIEKAIHLKMLNLQGHDGKTLLHYAVCLDDGENTKILDQLLRLPLNPNAKDHNGQTPLHYATHNKNINIKVVKMLLKAGASLKAKDNDERTPLQYAKDTRRKDVIVQLLLYA